MGLYRTMSVQCHFVNSIQGIISSLYRTSFTSSVSLLSTDSGRFGDEDDLSTRPRFVVEGARICELFVELEPTGEELLASRWSNALRAMALHMKCIQL
jgi:hypothetical protein